MKSFFNSIKKAVGSLTRTPEQTRAELADAVGKSTLPFSQEDGQFTLILERSKALLYPRRITLTPQKSTITGKIQIFVEAPEKGSYSVAALPTGYTAKPDKKSYDIEFELPADDFITALDAQIKNLEDVCVDAARKAGIPLFSHDTWGLRAAVEGMPLNVHPVAYNKNFLIMDESKEVPGKWYIFADIQDDTLSLVTAINAKSSSEEFAEKFKKEGLKADHSYPLVYAKHEIALNKIADVEALEKEISSYIRKVKYVLAKFAATKEFAPEKLNFTIFNCDRISRSFEKQHKDLMASVDEEGDVKLSFGSESNFAYERFGWVYITPVKVTVEEGIAGLILPDNAKDVVEALSKEHKDLIYSLSDENKLRIKMRIYPEEFSAMDANEKVHGAIDKAVVTIFDAWKEVLQRLGIRMMKDQFFDTDKIRKQFAKSPIYKKTDNDGDMKFIVNGDDSFRPGRFAWLLFNNNDKITLSAGISRKKSFWESVNLDDIIKKFNAKNTGFEAFKSDNTVHIRKRFKLNDYPMTNPTAKVLPEIDKALIGIFDATETLAAVLGLKTRYYIPDLDDVAAIVKSVGTDNFVQKSERNGNKLKLVFKGSKTTDGTELSYSQMAFEVTDDTTTIKSEVILGKQLEKSDTSPLADKMAKEMGYGGKAEYGYGFFYNLITLQNTSFDNAKQFLDVLIKILPILVSYEDKGSDLVLKKINADIAAERERQRQREAEERERQRRREEEARAERERNLSAWFTYTLRSGGTIRKLQESFTEDYPYLRICVFMVKTGQQADRTGGTIMPYSSDTTFGQIKSFKGECTIRIEGRSTPESLEREFRTKSGLVIKICYNDKTDARIYISKDNSDHKKCIFDLNRRYKELGYYTADIS